MIVARLCVLLALTGCAHQDEWTERDMWAQVAVSIAIIGDSASSVNIRSTDGIYERGYIASRVIGSQPTAKNLFVYMTSVIVLDLMVARALPAKWRPYFQGGAFVMHASAWHHNCQLGLC